MKRTFTTDFSRGIVRTFNLNVNHGEETLERQVQEILLDVLPRMRNLTCRLIIQLQFQRVPSGDQIDLYAFLPLHRVYNNQDIHDVIQEMMRDVEQKIHTLEDRGSGLIFAKFNKVELRVSLL